MLFKLIDLSIGSFAVVKASNGESDAFPINVHGFIQVVNSGEGKYISILRADRASEELVQSNEVKNLKKEAVKRTIEEISGKLGD